MCIKIPNVSNLDRFEQSHNSKYTIYVEKFPFDPKVGKKPETTSGFQQYNIDTGMPGQNLDRKQPEYSLKCLLPLAFIRKEKVWLFCFSLHFL